MSRPKLLNLAIAGVLAVGALGGAGAAYARNNHRQTNEAAIMANAKVTMAQAIAAAERQVGGKAVATGIEDQDGTVFWEVEVLKDNQRQKVLVDPQTGNVVKTVLGDNDEHENGQEHEDD
jgi:uncharacterized membrane protein YkoI